MSVTKDYDLFCLLEKVGPSLIRTKFGTENLDKCEAGFEQDCDLIGKISQMKYCENSMYFHCWKNLQPSITDAKDLSTNLSN